MKHLLPLAALLLTVSVAAADDNWPSWRGPNGDGVANGENYPTEWDIQSGKNVLWKKALPSRGGSTPAVWDGTIFVTATEGDRNFVLALDEDGTKVWSTTFGSKVAGKHDKASGANPSPVTDGKYLFTYFKSGDLACLNCSDGDIVWQTNLQQKYGENTLWWDLGTSPVLTDDHVVVTVMQTGPSYLVAFDKATGEVAWKQDRNLGAPEEAAQSYTTPVVIDYEGRQMLIVSGADHVTGHDATTGRQEWIFGGLNPTRHKYFRSISSAIVVGDTVIAPYARGGSLTAIRLGGKGDVTGSHKLWFDEGHGSDVPTPVAQDGRLYVANDKGEVHCLDVPTGKVIWSDRLERSRAKFKASPIIAGDKLYITREDGTVFVLATGDKFEVLAKNALGNRKESETTVATPVFVDGRIYLRTFEHLYAIAN